MDCDSCGLAECDLPDEVDPEIIFERVGGQLLCQGCASAKQSGIPLLSEDPW